MRKYTRGLMFMFLIFLSLSIACHFTAKPDIFPFFSWSLFSSMPLAHSDVTTFVAIIHSISNTTHEPVFFQYADSRVIDSHNVIVYAIIQNLGRNLASNKDSELQFRLLNDHLYAGTTYEIAKVKYNSFEFLKERKYTIVKSYGNFTKS